MVPQLTTLRPHFSSMVGNRNLDGQCNDSMIRIKTNALHSLWALGSKVDFILTHSLAMFAQLGDQQSTVPSLNYSWMHQASRSDHYVDRLRGLLMLTC
eukprot:6484033-Amphidinium_carterae.2